jgi:peptidyl-tRNA hydrolase
MKPSEQYVLKPFPKEYHEDVDCMITKAVDSIDFYLSSTIEETMNKYNRIIEGEKNNE